MKRSFDRSVSASVLTGAIVVMAMANGGCSAAKDAVSNVEQASQPCDEFGQGDTAIANLSIDGDTRAFVQASANLVAVASTAETAVLNACIAIDQDLQIPDTWTAMKADGGSSDAETTEACTQASNKIQAVLTGNASAGCELVISRGYCTIDAQAQASCESTCTGMSSCTAGDVTMSCTPAELTGQCNGDCTAGASCEGSATAVAQCQGSCEADCTGMCDSNPCMAKHCTGVCEGMCTGQCQVAANAKVMCGANVNCRGGCDVAYVAPKCETTVTPPNCTVSETCKASCTSNVEEKAVCTQPGASLECSGTISSDLQAVMDTVKKNLPSIVLLVQTQSKLVLDAANQVATTGQVVGNEVTSLGGKAISCAGKAVSADVDATASLNVSVNASAKVSGSCGGPTNNTGS
jgi:hypothetical protein